MALPSTKSVIAYPMSGYINRLQAMASSALLAEDLGASVRYCWVPFTLVPGGPEDVFSTDFVASYFISAELASETIGMTVDEIPLYVGLDAKSRVAWLRGHDVGEQALLPDLLSLLSTPPTTEVLTVVAGGSFGLGDSESLLQRKREYYRDLPLHPQIDEAVAEALALHPDPFIGLHLRYTDRALQSPSNKAIKRALVTTARESQVTSLFIASDTSEATRHWMDIALNLGLRPWTLEHKVLERTDPRSARTALVDWQLLSHAQGVVYFAASSFATEAVCAGGSWSRSVALEPSGARRARLQFGALAQSGWKRLRGS